MYVQRNIVARPCNHCCSGKAISITYSECVFVALGIQHAMRVRHVVICNLCGCNIYAVQQDTQSVSMSEFIHHVC